MSNINIKAKNLYKIIDENYLTKVGNTLNKTAEQLSIFTTEEGIDMYSSSSIDINAKERIVLGNYQEPPEIEIPASSYFVKGWWTDECDKPIKKAVIGDKVKFHIQMNKEEVLAGSKISFVLKDWDGGLNIDDSIKLYSTVKNSKTSIEIKEVVTDFDGKASLYIVLKECFVKFIKDDMGSEIELYLECSYEEEQKIKLPSSSGLYLNVNMCDEKVEQSFNNRKYGSCDFYRFRYDDFMRRHKYCGHMPPVYYFGEMRELGYWRAVDDIKEWWTPSLTQEMKQLSLSVGEVKKGGGSYKPVPSTSYGFKYCVRFSKILMPKLTERGKRWLSQARNNLQQFMEEGVIDKNYVATYDTVIAGALESNFNDNFEPSWLDKKFTLKTKRNIERKRRELRINYYADIEINNERFQKFAFATHPDAYNPVRMSSLPADDLWEIISTPDIKEWLGLGTWKQALIMARNLGYEEIKRATIERFFKKYVLNENNFE
ncbi:conserved hypothetical protein [Tenacibaculum maritimum]|uniref:hypothetical protein n=1 Tax=Tenacibaculum maritimum TaxID=107401 RepID=UPI0012E509D9|nr:hypothetical protein [Tenacibaculum maritimum]CAA0196799.1 conserved hypothetical protein [Tenacibaculum maritimum]